MQCSVDPNEPNLVILGAMKRRNVLFIMIVVALMLGGIIGTVILYGYLSVADRDAAESRVHLACTSVVKVLIEKFESSVTLLLMINNRIVSHGWLSQPEVNDMMNQIGLSLSWANFSISELQLVELSDFDDWQRHHHTITRLNPDTGELEPEPPIRQVFLPVLTRFPCCEALGFDWLSDESRSNAVLTSIKQNAPAVAFLPIISPRELYRQLTVFAPAKMKNQTFIGGVSALYYSESILTDASEFLETRLTFALFFEDELVFRQSQWADFNIIVNETFPVLNRTFTLECGFTYIAPAAPMVMELFGISLSLVIPSIALTSWKSIRDLRFKDRQILAAAREVQEARLKEREATFRYESEKALSEAKSQFMANISHEIRTPLNAISGMADFLLESELNGAQREYVKIIRSSLTTLLNVVNDVFDYALLETGQLTVNYEDFDLYEFIITVDRVASKAANERGNVFVLDCPLDRPTFITSDPNRIRQVLAALISNANKFTDHGTVVLTVRPNFEARILTLSVGDTGIGMTEEQRRDLFNAYRQLDQSHTRRFGGMGLGLALCKKLVSLMGGVITVYSEPDAGAVFTVTLPLVAGSPVDQSYREPYHGHGVILIADDNVVNLRVAEKIVRSLGYETLTATNGQEAIDKFNERRDIDLILMDGQMPVLDGYVATQMLRRQGVTIPIVCMTANVLPGEKQRIRELGMTDLVPKPVDKWFLSKVLYDLIK